MHDELQVLTDAIAHDIELVVSGITVSLEGLASPTVEELSAGLLAVDRQHLYPWVIAIRDSTGSNTLLLPFDRRLDVLEQKVNAVNQVQDMVIESIKDAWPRCGTHDTPLEVYAFRGAIHWMCPQGHMLSKVGELPA